MTAMAIPAARATTPTSPAASKTSKRRCQSSWPKPASRRFISIGTSSGAIRAAAYAQAQPERVDRLVLSAFTYKGNGAAEIARRQKRIAELRANPRRKRDAAMIRSIFTRDGHPEFYDPAVPEAIIAMRE